MNNIFNPFKSFWFYGGITLGVFEWAAIWLPDFATKLLLNLPSFFLIAAVFAFFILHAIAQWASPKIQEYAEADKRNFGPFIATSMSKSGHALTGIGIIALLHYIYTSVAGSNLQLFFICLCIAPSFYWHAWGIQQLIQQKSDAKSA